MQLMQNLIVESDVSFLYAAILRLFFIKIVSTAPAQVNTKKIYKALMQWPANFCLHDS